ncbi:MAG: tripartite tricarboxylate transporter TctB family protein [Dehalococcoidia bacterium]|nr:tripartite tricarboxylate transporter TctB family protein [Dehalococcoidia bacterium]
MNASRILIFIFFAFILWIVIYSFRYPPEARFGPLVIGIPAAVLIVVQIVRESLIRQPTSKAAPAHSQQSSPASTVKGSFNPYLEIAVCLIGMIAAIYIFGLLIGFVMFIVAYLKLHREGWLLTAALGLGVPALIYAIFEIVLHMPLDKGILFG